MTVPTQISERPTAATALPFQAEHEMFRTLARRFLETECAPHRDAWEAAGMAPRSAWKRAGELGLLCFRQPAAYGGQDADILFSVTLMEEQVRAGVVGPMLSLHNDVVAPYIELYGDEDQKTRVLPKMAAGDWIGAIAMTEPGGGSDLRGMTTRAVRDGDDYLISGQKTFISNGACADLIVLAAQTDNGISLFLVETQELAGFAHGEPLEKLGQWSADTTELFFDEMRVPASALLGGVEGRGFAQLVTRLVEERLMTAVGAVATMETALTHTIAYTTDRKAFGQRVIDFQNSRFRLAECQTEAIVCRTYLERCLLKFMAGRLTPEEAAMLKLASTEQQNRVVDACLQLHGGYGYMLEYPISRLWLDSRISRIYGGSNEIMKEIIGRAL
jgi:acyl-CoA dehydrogenase